MKTKLSSFCFKVLFIFGLLFSFSTISAQTPIATWTYDPGVIGAITGPTANFGTGTSSVINLATPTTANGLSSTTGCSTSTTTGNIAWQHPNFNPGAVSSNEVNGVQFNSGTTGFTNIFFTWDQRFSKTAPNTVRLQYTLNGSTWINFPMSATNTTTCAGSINVNGCFETNAGDSFRRIKVDFSLITGANNNANFGVRLLASNYQGTTDYRQSTDPTKIAVSNGTWRFDNVSFLGTPSAAGAVISGSTTICPSATANINVTITGGVSPYTVVYTNGSSNFTINSYTSGSNIALSPVTTTTYTLVSVKDNTNATITPLTGSAVVTVNAGVSPSFIASAGATSCANTNIVYTTQAGNDNYVWTFLNGVSPAVLNVDYKIIAGSTTSETVTIQWLLSSGSATFSTSVTYSSCSGTTATSSTLVSIFNSGAINTTGQTICNNGDPSLIGSSTAASGGDGIITYKWQANGVDIPGSNSVTYDPPSGLTVATTYTRLAKDGTCNTTFTQSTGSWVVTFYTAFTAGTISSTGQTVCAGGTTAMTTIGSTTPASGGNAGLTYQWQANGVTILGATSATYTPPSAPLVTTVYTRWANDGTCNTTPVQSSGSWTVTTTPAPIITVAPSPTTQTVCQGTAFTPLSVTATGTGLNYQWYSSTGNTNYSQLTPILIPATGAPAAVVPTGSGGKNPSFTPTSSTAGTFYYFVRVTSTGCTTAYSDYTAAYNVIATPTITSTFAVSSICTSATPQSATLNYTATTSAPTSYTIVWNAAALTAGFTNQGTTPISFSSGAGTITGITIPANLAPNQYTGSLIVTNANSCNSVPNVITINVGKKWNGATSNDWGTPSNWTPSGVPTAADCVVIPTGTPNSPVIAANAFAANLTINSSASLSVNTGIAVEVQDFVKTDGTFTLNNNSSLVQINNVANTGSGNVVYKRDVTGLHGYDYVYWSSPVAAQPINNLYSTPALGYKYYWDTLVDNGNGGTNGISQGNWAVASGNMSVGKGYIIRGSTAYGWTGTLTSTFTGIPNNGNINVPIARGSYQGFLPYVGLSGVNIYNTDDNMNLIGNPYPSAIKAKDFLNYNANSNIDGFIYLWTHNSSPATTTNPFYSSYATNYFTSDYVTFNSAGTSSGPATFNGYIAAGQGFFVSMVDGPEDATQSVIFTNTMRSKGYANSQFFKSGQLLSSTDNNHRIWIDLIDSTNQSNRILVGYCEGATNLKDRNFDAFTKVSNANLLYSLIGDESQVIQGRALPFDTNDQVPLGYHAQAAGNFTIAIAAVDGLFDQGQPIYLEDKLLNIIYDLRQAPYVFTTAQGTFNERFVLRYTNALLFNTNFSDLSASIAIYKSDNFITVKSDKTAMKEIMVYDIQGRLLNDFKNLNVSEFQFVAPTEKQVLLIKITTTDNSIVFRKFSN